MFYAAQGAGRRQWHPPLAEVLKIIEISMFFRKLFEWASEGHLDAKMTKQETREAEKITLGCLWADF